MNRRRPLAPLALAVLLVLGCSVAWSLVQSGEPDEEQDSTPTLEVTVEPEHVPLGSGGAPTFAITFAPRRAVCVELAADPTLFTLEKDRSAMTFFSNCSAEHAVRTGDDGEASYVPPLDAWVALATHAKKDRVYYRAIALASAGGAAAEVTVDDDAWQKAPFVDVRSAASSAGGEETAPKVDAKAGKPVMTVVGTAAREAFKKGQELYAAGDYAGALREFLEADSLRPDPKSKWNISVCALQLARQSLQAYVRETPFSDADRAALTQHLAGIQELVADQ